MGNARSGLLLSAVCLVYLHAASSMAAAPTQPPLLIHDVRVFDGAHVFDVTSVLVAGGRIAGIGAVLQAPAGATVVEGRGKTLLPGLIDAHVHVFAGAQRDALRFGVTTELDMFDVGNDLAAWKRKRESLAPTEEADTWAAGIGVTVPGGAPIQDLPPDTVPTLKDPKDARAFVDARVKEGSDYLKVFVENLSEYNKKKSLPTLSHAELCDVIDAAHADQRMAIVHVQAEWAAREAIACHADGIAHMFPDKLASPELIREARASKIFFISTTSVWAGASGMGLAKNLSQDPRVAPWLSEGQKKTLLAPEAGSAPSFFANSLANVKALHAAGVPILAGTDSGNPATAHGVSLHEELENLVKAGLTPIEALRAATSVPAAAFHLDDRGRIAVGRRADLLLVSGDITRDIDASLSIEKIWKNGAEVSRTPR